MGLTLDVCVNVTGAGDSRMHAFTIAHPLPTASHGEGGVELDKLK